MLLSGCNQNEQLKLKEKELELKEKELQLKQQQLEQESKQKIVNKIPDNVSKQSPPANNTSTGSSLGKKYILVTVVTKEPELQHMDARDLPPGPGQSAWTHINEINFVSYKKYVYYSDIVEIRNYSENRAYEAMDDYEKQIRSTLVQSNISYITSLAGINNSDRDKLLKEKSSVADRKYYVFDSYKSASLRKIKLKEESTY